MPHKASHQHRSNAPEKGTELRSFGEYQLFVGSEKSDKFDGSSRKDVAFGSDGNDSLIGGVEEDELIGNAGNDRLDGGDGMDHLVGNDGNDTLIGGGSADGLDGGEGNDRLDEGAGHGDLEGGRGNDLLTGGLGADAFVISPDSGRDVITDFQGGPGMFDHLAIRDLQPEQLRVTDTAEGAVISWSTAEGTGSVLLAGFPASKLAGDDFMFTSDRHAITGVRPDGTLIAEHFEKNEETALPHTGPKAESAANDGTNTAANYERTVDNYHIQFGADNLADQFQGTESRDQYFGLAGNDRLYGGAGDDHLSGDAGDDVLDGGDGKDDLRGGTGNDQLFGGGMADSLMGGAGDDYLNAGAGHDMVDGEEGNDILDGGDGADAFIVSTTSGYDVVVGGFDAGPGAFDHIAFKDLGPEDVTVGNATNPEFHQDGHSGVLVSWDGGAIFIEGLTESQMAQDDFMFNADMGTSGAFEDDGAITAAGSNLILTGMTTTGFSDYFVI